MSQQYGKSLFIGFSSSESNYPVFFDPHYSVLLNQPTVTTITGGPGSGKTFFGNLLASQASILNKTQFIIDPKGDFETPLSILSSHGIINNVEVWSALGSNDEVKTENIGALDPLKLYKDINENVSTTIDTIKVLSGGLNDKQVDNLIPLVRDEVEKRHPSFNLLIKSLSRRSDPALSSLGERLGALLSNKLARILVSDYRVNSREIPFGAAKGHSTYVISLMGVKFPSQGKDLGSYTDQERISLAIISILTNLILKLMSERSDKEEKILIIDEAWQIMASDSAVSMIKEIGLKGRSKNMALVLITQNISHLTSGNSGLETAISSVFTFRNASSKDNAESVRLMKIPRELGIASILSDSSLMKNGVCFMKGANDKVGRIRIVAPDDWTILFETNPNKKKF